MGSLPAGLALNASTGVISGTPTTVSRPQFTIRVQDAFGQVATRQYTVDIAATPLVLSAITMPRGMLGVAYSIMLNATGGSASYTFSKPTGTLPNGLSLDASTGIISGTPTATATFTFTAMVSDPYSRSDSKSFTIYIDPVFTITTTSLNNVVAGNAYNQAVAVTGGLAPYTWSITSGLLPTGLTLNSTTGIISGTPPTANSQQIVVEVQDTAGRKINRQYTLWVIDPLTLLTTSMPNGALNESYSDSLRVSGGVPPYTFTLTGQLPAGLSMNSSTGLISGIPTVAGLTNAGITIVDSSLPVAQSKSTTFSIRIWSLATIMTSASLPSALVNTAMTPVALTAKAGTAPYSWSLVSGAMPTGVTISTGGLISGTPTVAGNFTFTIRATDSSATPVNADKQFYLRVGSTIQISTQSISYGSVGVPFNYSLYAANGVLPCKWQINSGSLPTGLSLSTAGVISGTPTTVGSSTVTFQVTDSDNPAQTTTKSLTVSIDPLSITTQTLADGNQGAAYSATINATGNPVPALSMTGTLPTGLTFANKGNGTATITGTVAYGTAGSYPITVSATNTGGTVNQPLTLIVNKFAATVVLSGLNQNYNGSPRSVTATTTPPGLSVDITYDGSSAAPTNVGTYAVVATVSDSSYQGGATGNLTIAKAPQLFTFAANASKTYGAADFGPGAIVDSGMPITYQSSNTAVATITAEGLVHVVGAGTSTITASQAGDANHLPASAQQALTVNKAQIQVTADNKSRNYGASNPVFTATYSGFVNGQDAGVIGGTPTFTTNATPASLAGSYTITPVVTGLTADNYSFIAAPGTLAIDVASQTITFNQLDSKTYGDNAFNLTASGGASSNPIIYTSSDPAVATISGSIVTIKGSGSTNITANQAGITGEYASATAQQTLTVGKGTITVTADDKQRQYNTPNPALTATYSGFVYSDTAAVISGIPGLNTSATQASVTGSYAIVTDVSGLSASNYTFVAANGILAVNVANQAISFDPLAAKTYGDSPFDLSAAGGPSGNAVTFASTNTAVATVSGNTVTIIGTGTATITGSQAGSSNYAAASAQQILTVNKATVTVTADSTSRAYNAQNPTFTATFSGFVNGEDKTVLAGAPSLNSVAIISSPVGDYPITAAVGNLSSNNYSFSYVAGTLSITKAPATITIDNASLNQTYDGTAKAATATTTPVGRVVTFTYNGSSNAPINAGSYAVFGTINDINYAGTVNGTLIIHEPPPINGACGTSSGGTFAIAPATNLCARGTATTVTTNANLWNWTCNGFYGGSPASCSASLDSTPPTLTVSTLANNAITNISTLNISGTVSDQSGIATLTVNMVPVTVTNGAFSTAVTLHIGSNTITTIATDIATNQTTDTRTITLDQTAPALTITAPADNSAISQSFVTVTGSVNETSTVEAKLNGTSAQTVNRDGLNFSATVNLAAGINTIDITATDLAGNITTAKRTVTSDTNAPSLAVTQPAQDIATTQDSITISGTVADALTAVILTVSVDGQNYTPAITDGTFSQLITFSTGKVYAISVTAKDGAGNETTVLRNIIYNKPSGANIDLGTVSGVKGSTVTIPVTLTNVTGTDIAGIRVDISYDPNLLDNPTATIGVSGTAAGKTVSASKPTGTTGIYRVGVFSTDFNYFATPIPNGIIANITFTINAAAAPGSITLTNTPTASNPAADPVIVTGKNGAVNVIIKPGDCDNDGDVSITELQSAIIMFLGLKQPTTCVDTNGDLDVSITELQKTIIGFLGQ